MVSFQECFPLLMVLSLSACAAGTQTPSDTSPATASSCDSTVAGLSWQVGYRSAALTLLPEQLDPTIDWHRSDTPFVVMDPNETHRRDQLLVVLPGSGSSPERGSHLLNTAAFAGYHAIGLAFSNADSISELCSAASDEATCHAEIIAERLYGADSSSLVDVDSDNGVVGRLERLLHSLSGQLPDGGWDQFLVDGAIDWSKVVISGASQGGKTATFLSRDIAVERAVLLNAFGSAFQGGGGTIELAAWSLEPRATPPERVYGLWHEGESADAYGPLLLSAYGVDDYGDTVDVDDRSYPYGCSHMLRTALPPGEGNDEARETCDEHQSVGADDCVTLDDNGEPVLTPVWLYMMSWQEER